MYPLGSPTHFLKVHPWGSRGCEVQSDGLRLQVKERHWLTGLSDMAYRHQEQDVSPAQLAPYLCIVPPPVPWFK